MKKWIPKIMLGLAFLFLIALIGLLGAAFSGNAFWRTGEQLTALALLALSGLFLALYRILDLLENR